jgi:hypothetical protein
MNPHCGFSPIPHPLATHVLTFLCPRHAHPVPLSTGSSINPSFWHGECEANVAFMGKMTEGTGAAMERWYLGGMGKTRVGPCSSS